MKKLLLLATILLGLNSFLNAQLHFGSGIQYNLDASALGLQGKAFYEHNETWRGSGTFTFHLDDALNYSIDIDAHYLLLDVNDNFNLAPFGGLNYVSTSFDNDIGLNLGAFIDLNFEERHIYLEPKFILGDANALVISAGIYF